MGDTFEQRGTESGKKVFQKRSGQFAAEAKERLKSSLNEKKNRTSETLEGVARVVREAAEKVQDRGQAGRLAEGAAQKFEELATFLRGKKMDEIFAGTERLIKKQPAVFLGGSFALGFLVARFLKSSSSGEEDESFFAAEELPEGVTVQ